MYTTGRPLDEAAAVPDAGAVEAGIFIFVLLLFSVLQAKEKMSTSMVSKKVAVTNFFISGLLE
jgi:hypothetical protein